MKRHVYRRPRSWSVWRKRITAEGPPPPPTPFPPWKKRRWPEVYRYIPPFARRRRYFTPSAPEPPLPIRRFKRWQGWNERAPLWFADRRKLPQGAAPVAADLIYRRRFWPAALRPVPSIQARKRRYFTPSAPAPPIPFRRYKFWAGWRITLDSRFARRRKITAEAPPPSGQQPYRRHLLSKDVWGRPESRAQKRRFFTPSAPLPPIPFRRHLFWKGHDAKRAIFWHRRRLLTSGAALPPPDAPSGKRRAWAGFKTEEAWQGHKRRYFTPGAVAPQFPFKRRLLAKAFWETEEPGIKKRRAKAPLPQFYLPRRKKPLWPFPEIEIFWPLSARTYFTLGSPIIAPTIFGATGVGKFDSALGTAVFDAAQGADGFDKAAGAGDFDDSDGTGGLDAAFGEGSLN